MSKIRQVFARLALFGLLAPSLWACDFLGPDKPAGPGTLVATLVSPAGPEASAVFELSGGVDLGTVSPVGGQVLYQHFSASSRVVVVMDDPGEVSFQVRTEDVAILPEVTVIQVADGDNRLRTSLSGYRVVVTRAKGPSREGGG